MKHETFYTRFGKTGIFVLHSNRLKRDIKLRRKSKMFYYMNSKNNKDADQHEQGIL